MLRPNLIVNLATRHWKLIVALALFVFGVIVGRTYFPRTQILPVDREILKVVEKLIPGETRTIIREVPGPTRTITVKVPVEVEKIVRVPGEERVVTITKPVEVPVEVVREKWPQTITVRVGSVLSDKDEWFAPKFSDLLIGQVAPGVYAVPVQEGWKIEQVRTETRVTAPVASLSQWHLEIRPAVGGLYARSSLALIYGLQIQATKDHWSVEISAGSGTTGPWGLVLASWRF